MSNPDGSVNNYLKISISALALIVVLFFLARITEYTPQKNSVIDTAETNYAEFKNTMEDDYSGYRGADMEQQMSTKVREVYRMLLSDYNTGDLNNAMQAVQWVNERKEWIENFPYEPVYHPTMTYQDNPLHERELDVLFSNDLNAIKNMEDKSSETWESYESLRLGRLAFDMRQRLNTKKQPYREYRKAISQHGFMKNFHGNIMKYTKEFEAMYNIFKDEGVDNPLAMGMVFNILIEYHIANRKNPNDLHPTYKSGVFPPTTRGMERTRLTWGDVKNRYFEFIANGIKKPDYYVYGEIPSIHTANAIRDRIVNEIPSDELIDYYSGTLFGYHQKHEDSLNEGDPLLIPVGPSYSVGTDELIYTRVRQMHIDGQNNGRPGMYSLQQEAWKEQD